MNLELDSMKKLDLKTLLSLKITANLYSDFSTKTLLYNYICSRIKELELEKINDESKRNK